MTSFVLFIPLEIVDELLCFAAVFQVEVKLDYQSDTQLVSSGRPPNLKKVGFIVGVASCKGGSGKSTVSLCLALMLRKSGAKVGLLDADIYGPSLPTLLQMESARVRFAAEDDTDSEDDGGKKYIRPPSRSQEPTQDRKGRMAMRRTRIQYEDISSEGPSRVGSVGAPKVAAKPEADPSMLPIVVSGIKCMSYGFIAKEADQVRLQIPGRTCRHSSLVPHCVPFSPHAAQASNTARGTESEILLCLGCAD